MIRGFTYLDPIKACEILMDAYDRLIINNHKLREDLGKFLLVLEDCDWSPNPLISRDYLQFNLNRILGGTMVYEAKIESEFQRRKAANEMDTNI